MENRNGIVIDLRVGRATGRAEREHGLAMLQELGGARRITVAGDKGYDTTGFVAGCRELSGISCFWSQWLMSGAVASATA
jgi:hypothetical protein